MGDMTERADNPIEDGSSEATEEEGLRGIVEQVRADIDMGHTKGDAASLLRERLSNAGIHLSAEREAELADMIGRR